MSNARSFLGIFVSIPLFLLLVGTVHAKDVQFSGEVLTELEDPVSLVDTYMDYKKISKKFKCNIQIKKDSRYCVKIEHAISVRENNKSFIYATENGFALDKKNQRLDGHVASGYVKLFKFEFIGNHKIKLIAKSDLIECGSFGYPCQDYFYKTGDGPEMGWVLSTGFMNQGTSVTTTLIYAVVNSKIDEILNTMTEFDSSGSGSGSGSDGWTSEHYYEKVTTQLTTISTTSDRFSDLDVSVTSTKPKNKKLKQIDFHKVLKFNSKTNRYDTSEIDKFYDLDNYK